MSDSLKRQDLAKAFCHDEKLRKSILYIKNIKAFAKYNQEEGFYEILDDEEFETVVYNFILERRDKQVTSSMVRDVATQIKWTIKNRTHGIDSDYIALKDKVLETNSFEFEEKDYTKKAFHYIDISTDEIENSNPDRWFKFLDEVIVDEEMNPDEELQRVLQEVMGYYLFGGVNSHYFVYCVGGGQNGKGVFFNVLGSLIGKDFKISMSIEQLTRRFGPVNLIGKKLNICSEEESKYTKVDTLKALTAHDMITAERKYGPNITFRPITKHIFSSNAKPTFSGDLNKAIKRRLVVLPFRRTITEDMRDPLLAEKLKEELPGILSWAIEGYKRFRDNKYKFSESDAVNQKMVEFEKDMSSAVQFVKEKYKEKEGEFVSYKALYQSYETWINDRHRKIKSYDNFKKDVKEVCDLGPVRSYCNVTGKSKMSGLQLKYIDNEQQNPEPQF